MYFEERIYSILEKIKKEGRVKVAELAEIFNVSEVTIRKDLSELEEMGYLKRTFGGAILTQEHVKELSVEQKKIDNIEKKEIIAKKSAEFLKDGLDIFLDAGTTALYIAHEIIKFNNITVITYDLEIASFLSKYDNIKTYMIGGFIDTKNKLALSIDGYKSLQRMHTDLAFIGTDAFDMNYVYSTNDLKSQLKKIMSGLSTPIYTIWNRTH